MKGRTGMQARLTMAALTRRPGMVVLAVVAVAIGASVAAALLHVSADVTRKLTRELRVLGPNLVMLPDEASGGFLDEAVARGRVRNQRLMGAPLLYMTAVARETSVRVVGADLAAARAIHPSWRFNYREGPGMPEPIRWPARPERRTVDHLEASLPREKRIPLQPTMPGTKFSHATIPGGAWIGSRLAGRFNVGLGDTLALAFPRSGRTTRAAIGAVLESGGIEDESIFIPLAEAQALAGSPGVLSAMEIRVEGDAADARRVAQALEAGGGVTARVRFALSRTEADLLERMRRLMSLVTLAALVSAGLCAFGTLTDLALERRKEIALLKALGATRIEIVWQFALESLAIGVAGGLAGWVVGVGFAQVIGRTVFESPIALRADVPLMVLGLATLVAVLAGLGPIRLALAVDPARVLKGD